MASHSQQVKALQDAVAVLQAAVLNMFSQVPTVVVRALNTNFKPSATKNAYVRYVVAINCTLTLGGSQVADCALQISADGNTWITADQGGFTQGGGLVLGVSLNQTLRVSLSCFVPPNYFVRLLPSGTGTVQYVNGIENIIN